MKSDYARNDFHDWFYVMESFFLKHKEDRVIKPFIDINPSERNYKFHIFDISNQKDHIAAQSNFRESKFHEKGAVNVLYDAAFALILTNRLKSINSDGRRMFVLI